MNWPPSTAAAAGYAVPAGSPLGAALAALAAAVHAADRRLGSGPELTWALIGMLGLARHLMPARGG